MNSSAGSGEASRDPSMKALYDFIVITGPTGVGKTELALALGSHIPLEIINGDVGQFYTPLTIGTAKPAWRDQIVPHHLFDILDTPSHYSVASYRHEVHKLIEDIKGRNALPVIVGGSCFYIQSLFFPALKGQEKKQAQHIESHNFSVGDLQNFDNYALWEKLALIDPQRAEQIHPHDRYRVQRALTLWFSTGKIPSLYKPVYSPLGKVLVIFVQRDRHDLYQAINERVVAMIEQGWAEEVASLSPNWHDFLLAKKIIGYPDFIQALALSKKVLPEIIQQRTRRYAKRQITFLKKLETELLDTHNNMSSVETINLTLLSLPLYIDQLKIRLYTPRHST